MKNKKPLKFVKELPPHAELWKIIDDTITHPAEGLSVKQIKHYMYFYLCVTPNFKEDKHFLQTNMTPENLQIVKARVSQSRTIKYPELLPQVEGLPLHLLVFIYNHYISSMTLPNGIFEQFDNIALVFFKKVPNLSTLPHSTEIVEVYEKRQVELAVYRALIDKTAIPTFRLVLDNTDEEEFTYPIYCRAKSTGLVVKFTGLTSGEITQPGLSSHTTGDCRDTWVPHTDDSHWEPCTPEPVVDSDGWIEWNGGGCPVDTNTKVEIRHRAGSTAIHKAVQYRWSHENNRTDIIAYRIIEEDNGEA